MSNGEVKALRFQVERAWREMGELSDENETLKSRSNGFLAAAFIGPAILAAFAAEWWVFVGTFVVCLWLSGNAQTEADRVRARQHELSSEIDDLVEALGEAGGEPPDWWRR